VHLCGCASGSGEGIGTNFAALSPVVTANSAACRSAIGSRSARNNFEFSTIANFQNVQIAIWRCHFFARRWGRSRIETKCVHPRARCRGSASDLCGLPICAMIPASTSGTTYASTYRMYTRHVEGRPKFINEIIALSKWRLPPCTPRHIPGFSSYLDEHAGFAAMGSLCPPGFAPHYVAVQPGRCRRFMGHCLLALNIHLAPERRGPRSRASSAAAPAPPSATPPRCRAPR
jgi:hypothetical protein